MKSKDIKIETFSNMAGGNIKLTHVPTNTVILGSYGRRESPAKLRREMLDQLKRQLTNEEEK